VLAHGLGTKNLMLACFDSSDVAIQPDTWAIAGTAPYSITVTFTTAQTGRCVVNGTGSSKYAADFTSQTTVTITGATHNLGTCDLLARIYDASSPRRAIEPDAITCDATSKDVVVTFASAQSGRIVLN
jgi:hypothetical protein